MQLSSGTHIPDGLLAANALLSEKPHQGLASKNPAPYQGINEANSTAAIGLRASEHLNRARYRYTGKERDTESGLDYFGARYYVSSAGRFLSPDPSNWGVDFYYPQTWNRYSYAGNNPIGNIDPNGFWLTPTHNSIINNAFPGLSKEQRQILMSASREVDTHQSQDEQYMHNLANGDDVNLEGNYKFDGAVHEGISTEEYIRSNEQQAKNLQAEWIASGHTGIAPSALAAFGNALHPITDGYSPSHAGHQVFYWSRFPWHAREGLAIVGLYGNGKRSAEAAARAAFFDVFGVDLGQQATHEKVTVTIRFGYENADQCLMDCNSSNSVHAPDPQ